MKKILKGKPSDTGTNIDDLKFNKDDVIQQKLDDDGKMAQIGTHGMYTRNKDEKDVSEISRQQSSEHSNPNINRIRSD